MATLEIIGENLQCYLYIYINNNVYCLDKANNNLNLELPQGKYTMTIIGTKAKEYNLEDSLKSMSFSIKPALFQGYKSRGFLNHILGWNNITYFFIKKININIKSKATINLAVKDYYVINFFDAKETVKDVEITTNPHIKSDLTQNFNFVSKKQKIKYYLVQFLLLLLKLFLNIGYMCWILIDAINYVFNPESYDIVSRYYPTKFDIIFSSIIILIFFSRFIFYCIRIFKNLGDNSDVLNLWMKSK